METPALQTLRRVQLQAHHHTTDSQYTLVTESGRRSFSDSEFIRLEIAAYPGEQSCYMFHIAADGNGTDTFHSSIDDAIDFAQEQYGVQPDEWSSIAGITRSGSRGRAR
jgi:hypothetical protein